MKVCFFLHIIILKIVATGVHRNDNEKMKLKISKHIFYEKLFSDKIYLKIVSMGTHRYVFNANSKHNLQRF